MALTFRPTLRFFTGLLNKVLSNRTGGKDRATHATSGSSLAFRLEELISIRPGNIRVGCQSKGPRANRTK